MAWISTTLDNSMAKAKSEADILLNNLQIQLSETQQLLNKTQEKLDAINNLLILNDTTIQRLEESGLFVIVLSPANGTWIDRLQKANNAPTSNENDYSTISASIATSPNISSLWNTFDQIIKTTTQQFIPPQFTTPKFDISDINLDDEIKFEMNINVWQTITMKELNPSVFNVAKKNNNELKKTLQSLQNNKDASDSLITQLQSEIINIQQFINDLQNTGIFSILLTPQIGSWNNRMLNEPNSPPLLNASTGICVVGIEPNLLDINNRYDSIIELFA